MPRRIPIGAEVCGELGVHFRVWAPRHSQVSVELESSEGRPLGQVTLEPERAGYFSGYAPSATAGHCYRYRLGAETIRVPDPASRFQPQGPHGPSEIIDPGTFAWTDGAWKGVSIAGQVLYELHIGTFTDVGTWHAAMQHLPRLASLGMTTIEVMPVAEFPGRFGWGYDGVSLYAPSHLYGQPDDFRRFVDRAHTLGLAVVLDVVYNHLGPDGNYLGAFASEYFSTRDRTEWGVAINFDGYCAGPVREFMTANAGYWIDEFHLDGLRFDATQQIFDTSPEHLLVSMQRHARDRAGARTVILIAENEPQDTRLVNPVERGGFGLDALWNDDFHHAATVAVVGRREAYYSDYRGSPQELVSLVKWSFLYQGQRSTWQHQGRGTSALGIDPARFVTFLQNHDQIPNGPPGHGERIHQLTSPAAYRAMTAFWLLSPGTPMFFQGQEFGASSPFLFFADHVGEIGAAVRRGRAAFMSQFRSPDAPDFLERLPDPGAESTFRQCKLNQAEAIAHQAATALHRDLLRLRREDPVLRARHAGHVDGAVLGPRAFLLRFFSAPVWSGDRSNGEDRLVMVNLGADLPFDPAPEPLLASPSHGGWNILWSSEDPVYGGGGTAPLKADGIWRIPGPATVVLTSGPP